MRRAGLPGEEAPLLYFAACAGEFADPARELRPRAELPADGVTVVVQPTTLGVVDTPLQDVHGSPIGVGCDSCHGGEAPIAARPGEPERFHTGVDLVHGDTSCDGCHSADRLGLHLADGSPLAFGDVVQLCAQCHGPQWRDYQHGAHGGMTGAWDLRRGDRSRNSCIVCHPAHAPAYPVVQPAPGPRDRFGADHG